MLPNITAAGAVDREFVYIWDSQRSFCGSLWGALGALGVPFGALCGVWGVTLGRFGVLLEGLGVCGGALWAALGCLWELLGCGPLWGALGCLGELLGCVGSLWAALEVMLLWDVSVITKMNQKWWSVAQNQTLGCFGDHQNEPRVMECCSKADFGMFFGRGQYDKSDGSRIAQVSSRALP